LPETDGWISHGSSIVSKISVCVNDGDPAHYAHAVAQLHDASPRLCCGAALHRVDGWWLVVRSTLKLDGSACGKVSATLTLNQYVTLLQSYRLCSLVVQVCLLAGLFMLMKVHENVHPPKRHGELLNKT